MQIPSFPIGFPIFRSPFGRPWLVDVFCSFFFFFEKKKNPFSQCDAIKFRQIIVAIFFYVKSKN